MSEELNRRGFLKKSAITSAGAALGLSLEEKILLAKETEKTATKTPKAPARGMPMGKIGKLKISRLTIGGNLISGFAHSRNLIYVSSLLKHYFTDDKIIETLRICEENGINTAILRTDKDTIRVLNRYWKKEGGKIQWIAQTYPKTLDLTTNIQTAIDNGAVGAFMQGGVGDKFWENGHTDLLGKVVEFVQKNGLIAGIGSHKLEVPMDIEEAGIKPDFYFKTLNNVDYNCDEPEKVIEYMEKVDKPWIAYKVLGAGVTRPNAGFKYAFESGADFMAVGMYDFQIKDDVVITKNIFSGQINRQRPWLA
ncbi:MAG: twin-arginine translocation signal domain-containing protein [Planctomycetota bacterium]|jgi:hypothetical protein